MLPFYEQAIQKLKAGKKLTAEEGKAVAENFEVFAKAYATISGLVATSFNRSIADPVQQKIEAEFINVCITMYHDAHIQG